MVRITVRQRVTDYGSASPTVRPVGQTCRTSSVCRRPCGLGMEFATHHRRASPFLRICASLASTQEIFCYLSHLLPTFRPTMWNGLRATPFGVSHSLIGSKMKPHSRFLYESDRDINGRLAPPNTCPAELLESASCPDVCGAATAGHTSRERVRIRRDLISHLSPNRQHPAPMVLSKIAY